MGLFGGVNQQRLLPLGQELQADAEAFFMISRAFGLRRFVSIRRQILVKTNRCGIIAPRVVGVHALGRGFSTEPGAPNSPPVAVRWLVNFFPAPTLSTPPAVVGRVPAPLPAMFAAMANSFREGRHTGGR